MTKTIESHVVEGDPNSASLVIVAIDDTGPGGAHHEYVVYHGDVRLASISFQNGPIGENGINGVTQEVLLAIVKHRLECFQAGEFPSVYNERALTHVDEALKMLKRRTEDRIKRGVEGRNKA